MEGAAPHATNVTSPSDSTSPSPTQDKDRKTSLKELVSKKDEIEAEIERLINYLTGPRMSAHWKRNERGGQKSSRVRFNRCIIIRCSFISDLLTKKPIARVDQVMDGSPAQRCGLTAGDLVLRFGSVVDDEVSGPSTF